MIGIRAKAKAKSKDSSMAVMALEAISMVRSQAQHQQVHNMDHSRRLPKEASMPQRSTTSPAPTYQMAKAHSNLDM